jgi:hypothetical protein
VRHPEQFDVQSDKVQYTAEHILADYEYYSTSVESKDGKKGRGGGHNDPEGYRKDVEKYNAIQMYAGAQVLRLATGQVDDAHVVEIIDYINRRAKA